MKKLKIILESKVFLGVVVIAILILSIIRYNAEINYNDDTFVIESIDDNCRITTNHVLINYYGKCDFKIGDLIKVDGNLEDAATNTNFNLFNYKLYLRSKGIYYIMKNPKIKLIRHTNNIFYKIKNKMIERLNDIDNPYLYTFILGDNSKLNSDIKGIFQSNGISHLFSISGMHVSLISLIILTILNKIKKSKINYVIVIFILFVYSFLVGFTPSITRAFLMFTLLILNKKINIKTIYIFIYLLLGFISYNPYIIYNVGFVFSFTITFFLIRYGNINNNNYFFKLFHISFISFLGSIPILINNFNSINLLSPILNLLFVPFISIIIFPLSIISFIFPIFNSVLMTLLSFLEFISLITNKLSINIILCHIPFYIIILYYLVIILILKGYKKYICVLIIIIFIHHNLLVLNNEIHFIDVGQGDSAVLRLKYNKTVMIDTGGNISYDISKNTLIPYLKSLGIKKINYLIISHGDFDQMGGSINLVNNFKVEKVVFNCGPYNDLEKKLIKVLAKKHIKYYSCIKELNIDKNKLYFLQTKEYDNENDNSNVIYTDLDGYKFMFMGDAGIEREKDIKER